MNRNIDKEIKINICKEHIGGLLGEAILQLFLKEKLIVKNDTDEYKITDKGWEDLEIIGININELNRENNKIVSICIEKDNGILFEHIGSKLGSLIHDRFFQMKWLLKVDDNKTVLSKKGILGLLSLGVKIKRYNLT